MRQRGKDAFAFFDSLTAEQQATLTAGDVTMCTLGDTCEFTTGAGLTSADLTDEQRELLLDLIRHGRRAKRRRHPREDRGWLLRAGSIASNEFVVVVLKAIERPRSVGC